MSKKAAAGLGVAAVLLVTLVACVFATDWSTNPDMTDEMHTIEYGNHDGITTDGIYDADGNLKQNTLNYAIFEEYGPLMIVLAALMFGAMVGGVCIAREEEDD